MTHVDVFFTNDKANELPCFRDKFKLKLEAMGATLHLDDITKVNGKRGRRRKEGEDVEEEDEGDGEVRYLFLT